MKEGDFVLILMNHYNWSPTSAACHVFVSNNKPSHFFFVDSSLSQERKRPAKDNSRLWGGFSLFNFNFIFLSRLGISFLYTHLQLEKNLPAFIFSISDGQPHECRFWFFSTATSRACWSRGSIFAFKQHVATLNLIRESLKRNTIPKRRSQLLMHL